jgi:cytoskeletal protein CcmA (bactofilin family)
MFGKNGTAAGGGGGASMETVIGADTIVQGTLSSKGSLRVDGKVEGGITDADSVVIGQTGDVQGDINAKNVVIGGKVIGNITASNIEILTAAAIHGYIKTAALAISEGANFEGNCTMTKEKHIIEMDVKNAAKRQG